MSYLIVLFNLSQAKAEKVGRFSYQFPSRSFQHLLARRVFILYFNNIFLLHFVTGMYRNILDCASTLMLVMFSLF
jgi:hypothetical protein